jgi:hypothetical protein
MADDPRTAAAPPESPTEIWGQTGLHVPGLDDVRCTQAGGDDMADDPRTRMRPPENEQSIGRQTGIEAPGIADVRWPMEEALVTSPDEILGPNDGPDEPPKQSAAQALNEP